MEQRIGIIAGSGQFPLFVLKEAQKQGYICAVAGIKGQAEKILDKQADIIEWIDVWRIEDFITFFKKNEIKEAVFAGKVDHHVVFKEKKFDEDVFQFLRKEKSPEAVIHAVIEFMADKGIQIRDSIPFIASSFCQEGILTDIELRPEKKEDIEYGWRIAKRIADLDIGQTLIVKDKAVIAVEGMEGTDEAIKRGGQLAGEGTVVLKVSRSFQDARVDLPAVGLYTVKHCVEAKAAALCFEAQKIPFFQKEESISLAVANNISIVVKR